jgi:hypothetical protein
MKSRNRQANVSYGRFRAQSGAIKPVHVVLMTALIVIASIAAYFVGFGSTDDASRSAAELPAATESAATLAQPGVDKEALVPVTEEALVEPTASSPPEPVRPSLPPLEESDVAIRDALAAIPLGTPGQQYLLSSNIIERSSSALYLMSQGDVPYKLIPIARPKTPFPISDDGLKVTADASGFSRYDALSAWLRQLDAAAIVEAVEWLKPLFREAWSFYGEPADAFDFAVLNVLDSIITTPEIDLTEVPLIRKEAVWIYEDPDIEALSPLQKQIVRMGPDNALVVKAVAAQTRDMWVSTVRQE